MKHWPLTLAVTVFLLVSCLVYTAVVIINDGHFIYVLDDPYIHMAMAKNFAEYGVWGVTKYEFSSSSSSPLWTSLISAVYISFGVNDISPLLLNIIIGSLVIFLLYRIITSYQPELKDSYVLLMLLAIIFITPLIPMVFCGMEHTAHIFVCFLFIWLAARSLSEKEFNTVSFNSIVLLAVVPFVVFLRYEGMFLVFIVTLLFLFKKRIGFSFLLGILAVIPFLIYGAVSVVNGELWLPNSVYVKGSIPYFKSLDDILAFFVYSNFKKLIGTPSISLLLIAAIFMFTARYRKGKGLWENVQIMLLIFISMTVLHALFARFGFFFRYEAYLIAVGSLALVLAMIEYLPRNGEKIIINIALLRKNKTISAFCLLLVLSLAGRGIIALGKIPIATKNIYEQQYQMGLFLKKYYQGQGVMANDIGVINYLADIKCVDLMGLGKSEIALMVKSGKYNKYELDKFLSARDVKIGILYSEWFKTIIYQWVPVGSWKIKNNVNCYSDTVSFYTTKASDKNELVAKLKKFKTALPLLVEQKIY